MGRKPLGDEKRQKVSVTIDRDILERLKAFEKAGVLRSVSHGLELGARLWLDRQGPPRDQEGPPPPSRRK